MRGAVAILGGLALAGALLAGLAGSAPRPGWLLLFLIGWAVLTPYWWYLEYRLWAPTEGAARADFLAQQTLSFRVWLGGLVALVALLLWRST